MERDYKFYFLYQLFTYNPVLLCAKVKKEVKICEYCISHAFVTICDANVVLFFRIANNSYIFLTIYQFFLEIPTIQGANRSMISDIMVNKPTTIAYMGRTSQ